MCEETKKYDQSRFPLFTRQTYNAFYLYYDVVARVRSTGLTTIAESHSQRERCHVCSIVTRTQRRTPLPSGRDSAQNTFGFRSSRETRVWTVAIVQRVSFSFSEFSQKKSHGLTKTSLMGSLTLNASIDEPDKDCSFTLRLALSRLRREGTPLASLS
jgi:hypothetical protein